MTHRKYTAAPQRKNFYVILIVLYLERGVKIERFDTY